MFRLSSGTPAYLYNVKHNSSMSSNLGSKDTYRTYDPGVCEITNIPDDYLSQSQVNQCLHLAVNKWDVMLVFYTKCIFSQVLKHLAKEVKVPYSSDNKNAEPVNCSSSQNNEWYSDQSKINQSFRSKSQPDLTRIHKAKTENPIRHTLGSTRYKPASDF